ncbi:MAG: YgaP family membrane protein [Thiotrichales bacterium]
MTVNRVVTIFAGFMVMLSLALAHIYGQIDITKFGWTWFTAFVGFNLFQSGFTGFCPLASILRALGVKDA